MMIASGRAGLFLANFQAVTVSPFFLVLKPPFSADLAWRCLADGRLVDSLSFLMSPAAADPNRFRSILSWSIVEVAAPKRKRSI